jgi:F-box and WD-40 domain protein 1/11/F-box/WD-40 domain protein 7
MQTAIKSKAYKKKLKRHKDAVLSLYSPKGMDGGLLVSGSADHSIRTWDLLKKKISSKLQVNRPEEDRLFKFKEKNQVEPVNYAEDHILNNPKTLQK